MRDSFQYMEMDLTPLIDVVFLLLVFFMVSSEFRRQEQQLELNLPKSAISEIYKKAEKPGHILEISANELRFNQKNIDLDQLVQLLSQEEQRPVRLRVDENSPWQVITPVLESLEKHGFIQLLIEIRHNEGN
jgi:biopolymer transport protein ExbD